MLHKFLAFAVLTVFSCNVLAQDSKTERTIMQEELRALKLELKSLTSRVAAFENLLSDDSDSIHVVFDEVKVSFGSKTENSEALERIKRLGNMAYLGGRMDFHDGWRRSTIDRLDDTMAPEFRAVLQEMPVGRMSTIIESENAYRIVVVRERRLK